MLVIPPAKYQKRHRSAKRTTPPAVLTLISAVYNDDDDPMVTLTFNEPISLSGLVGTAIQVNDAQSRHHLYDATGSAALLDPVTVRFILESIGVSSGSGIRISAAADNGIVASDDGAAWAGVENLTLPFSGS